jgi:hypothetical protein
VINCFDLFQAIHASGGYLKIGPNGTVTGHAPGFGEDVKTHKAEILDSLWSEVRLWPEDKPYLTSSPGLWNFAPRDSDAPLAWKIEEMVQLINHLGKFDKRILELKKPLLAFDQACQNSHDAGIKWMRDHRDEFMQSLHDLGLFEKPLEGVDLIKAAEEIFEVKSNEHQSINQ